VASIAVPGLRLRELADRVSLDFVPRRQKQKSLGIDTKSREREPSVENGTARSDDGEATTPEKK
jgi:hypothetical protein